MLLFSDQIGKIVSSKCSIVETETDSIGKHSSSLCLLAEGAENNVDYVNHKHQRTDFGDKENNDTIICAEERINQPNSPLSSTKSLSPKRKHVTGYIENKNKTDLESDVDSANRNNVNNNNDNNDNLIDNNTSINEGNDDIDDHSSVNCSLALSSNKSKANSFNTFTSGFNVSMATVFNDNQIASLMSEDKKSPKEQMPVPSETAAVELADQKFNGNDNVDQDDVVDKLINIDKKPTNLSFVNNNDDKTISNTERPLSDVDDENDDVNCLKDDDKLMSDNENNDEDKTINDAATNNNEDIDDNDADQDQEEHEDQDNSQEKALKFVANEKKAKPLNGHTNQLISAIDSLIQHRQHQLQLQQQEQSQQHRHSLMSLFDVKSHSKQQPHSFDSLTDTKPSNKFNQMGSTTASNHLHLYPTLNGQYLDSFYSLPFWSLNYF